MSTKLTFKLVVDYVVCEQCGVRPKSLDKKIVQQFIRRHHEHDAGNGRHLRVVGTYVGVHKHLEKQGIAIRFVYREHK